MVGGQARSHAARGTATGDIASSNSTLQVFLGDQRSKYSWMSAHDTGHHIPQHQAVLPPSKRRPKPVDPPSAQGSFQDDHNSNSDISTSSTASMTHSASLPSTINFSSHRSQISCAATQASPEKRPEDVLPSPAPSDDFIAELRAHSIGGPEQPNVTNATRKETSDHGPPEQANKRRKFNQLAVPINSNQPMTQSTEPPSVLRPEAPQTMVTRSDMPRANYYEPQHCQQLIRNIISRSGGTEKLNHIENARLLLLHNSVQRRDNTYLLIHQLMCLATVDQNFVPQLVGEYHIQTFVALDIIGKLLVNNSNVRWEFLLAFAEFPAPISILSSTHPEVYNLEMTGFKRFVMLLSQNWRPYQTACLNRGFPPLIHELINVLGVTSYTLQEVVFSAVLRSFGCPEPSAWWDEWQAVFKRNQNDHTSILRHQRDSTSSASIVRENAYRDDYLIIYARHRAASLNQHRNRQANANGPVEPHVLQNQLHSPRDTIPGSLHPRVWLNPQACGGSQSTGQVPTSSVHAMGQNDRRHPTRGIQIHVPPGQYQIPSSHGSMSSRPHVGQLPTPSSPVILSRMSQNFPRDNPPRLSPPKTPLLPQHGRIAAQQATPDPLKISLHQLHLRDLPILGDSPAPPRSLFQFVEGFSLLPQCLEPSRPFQTFSFEIPASYFVSIPRMQHVSGSHFPMKIVNENTKSFRLRCVRLKDNTIPSEQTWTLTETSWPFTTYFNLNGAMLEERRKLHNGKDLPIDITTNIREGQNELQVSIIRQRHDKTQFQYAIAVEVVGIQSHETIKKQCKKSCLSSDRVLNAIKATLATKSIDNDDEISVVSSNLTITLFDPFSACKIFDIPVRGKNCLHYDCFDLETFLQTRPRDQPFSPSHVDVWKCPICKADTRAKNLIIDEFLVGVRLNLVQRGLLDTRAIVVEQDGSWSPKLEKDYDKGGEETKNLSSNSVLHSVLPLEDSEQTDSSRTTDVVELDSD